MRNGNSQAGPRHTESESLRLGPRNLPQQGPQMIIPHKVELEKFCIKPGLLKPQGAHESPGVLVPLHTLIQWVQDRARESALLTSSQEMLMLLVCGAYQVTRL